MCLQVTEEAAAGPKTDNDKQEKEIIDEVKEGPREVSHHSRDRLRRLYFYWTYCTRVFRHPNCELAVSSQ